MRLALTRVPRGWELGDDSLEPRGAVYTDHLSDYAELLNGFDVLFCGLSLSARRGMTSQRPCVLLWRGGRLVGARDLLSLPLRGRDSRC